MYLHICISNGKKKPPDLQGRLIHWTCNWKRFFSFLFPSSAMPSFVNHLPKPKPVCRRFTKEPLKHRLNSVKNNRGRHLWRLREVWAAVLLNNWHRKKLLDLPYYKWLQITLIRQEDWVVGQCEISSGVDVLFTQVGPSVVCSDWIWPLKEEAVWSGALEPPPPY